MAGQPLPERDVKICPSFLLADALWNPSPERPDELQRTCTPTSEQEDHDRLDWTAIGLLLGAGILTILWHYLLRT